MTFTNENAPNAGRHEANFETTNDSNTNQDQVTSQADSMPLLCSGFGQFHTNESGKKNRRPYVQINLEEIRKLVDEPQRVDKSQAQWLIPSTLLSRTFKEQEVKGEFHLLWADIDENPNGIHGIAEIIEDMIPGYNFEIYTSKSATEANQKCRILIPSKPLLGSDWVLVQEMLNDKLEAYGIQPDRTSEGAAQLCYLSNRGEFYKTKSKRDGLSFDPMREWAALIQIKCEKEKARIAEQERRKSEAKSKREAFNSYSGTDDFPSLIDAFNAAYTVQDILLQAGYDQKGNTFRHPNSESGSFSASVKSERVHSLSSNDLLYTGGEGGGAHDAFSAFTVLFHDGDQDAALKEAGNNWVMIGSESWNTVKQREYAQQKNNATFESDIHLNDEKEQPVANNNDNLPSYEPCLLNLPDGLGLMQDYIHNQMVYPDKAIAGVTALVYLSHYAQTRAIVKSPLGKLALSEYYIVMAKTGFGKEKLRIAFDHLDDRLRRSRFWAKSRKGASFQRAIPASPQGLHKLLEENPAQTFTSDEFAEWLIQSSKSGGDTYKRATVGYLMEIYTKGLSSVDVPNAVTNRYKTVYKPRVTIFATTTGERLAESLTLSQADSGTYNRFVTFVGMQSRIVKKYDGYIFDPSTELLGSMEWLLNLSKDTPLNLSKDAIDHFKEFDNEVIEPLKFDDPQLAGRLSEQALKMAGLIALGAQRTEISNNDLSLAYKIRLNLYQRSKAYLINEGSMTGEDATAGAYNQIAELISKKEKIPLSRLPDYSRKYRALKIWERESVIKFLERSGLAIVAGVKGGNCLVRKK